MRISRTSTTLAVVAVTLAVGCSRSTHKQSAAAADDTAQATDAGPKTSLERFPSDDPVLGSKTYPMRTIKAANLLGRIKDGPPESWPFSLVDARPRVEFEDEHIPGAKDCPAEKIEMQLASIVPDKAREIVFYCNGPNCTKSHKAGRAAMAAGWSHVVIFDEGMPGWRAAKNPIEGNPLPDVEVAKISPAALRDALKAKTMTLVDIRPRDEFLTFRIAGAVNLELDELEGHLKEHVKPGSAVCVADYTGHQQDVAGRLLSRMGYPNVKALDGGMRGWQQANLPVEKGLDKAVGETAKVETTAKGAGAKGAVKP
jgi:rhodanese-related sulfurtransferase